MVKSMHERSNLKHAGLAVFVLALAAIFMIVWLSPAVFYFKGMASYAPLHTLLETISVSVAALIFGLGWNSHSAEKPINHLIFACLFLAVALIDVAHFLSFVGMPDFVTASSAEKAISFWLSARFVAAMALLLFVLLPWRTSSLRGLPYLLLGGSLALAALVYFIGLFHADVLPATFIPGKGLTSFKIGAEYFVIAIHAITALMLLGRLQAHQKFDAHRLLAATCIMMLSELCFTLYSDVADVFNVLGHVYKVIAYGFLYKTMFADNVKAPYMRLQEAERKAWNDKECAEVTLASIGDAVITTGIDGRVQNINTVAETLTGWSMTEAQGRELGEVFRIVSDDGSEVVANPAFRAMREGAIVGLANHTMLISRSGKRFSIEDSAAPIRDRQGKIIGCVLVFHDVTTQREAQSRVDWHATHDLLTGLPNRILLTDRVEQAIAQTRRKETLVIVCIIDLDRFKTVNEQHGHEVGDDVLVEMADRFRLCLRESDTVARLGGDEFCVLLSDIGSMDQVTFALQRILATAAEPFIFASTEFQLTASMGVSVFPYDEVDADSLMRHAEQSMYVAKELGRNRYQIFDPEQDKRAQSSRSQVERIRHALHHDELLLYYQPKVNMRSGEVVGLEALLRWQHPELGLVPPGEFLPLIEQSELIVEIGEWVIQQAFRQMSLWQREGLKLTVSVNIAARHLQLVDFVARMDACLQDYPHILPAQLELEVLESAALDDMNHVRMVMQACVERGINFALDDFGTGYSSLSYLKQLSASTLKIDQSFIRNMLDDQEDLALTEAIIGLGATFGRKVIAEGVETAVHGVLLMRLGCDLAQGYGIARPMPASDVAEWVRNYKPDPEWQLWRNVTWEMADFPLLVAQHEHLKWIRQVIDSLDGMPLRVPTMQLSNQQPCRFGQWYHGAGALRYAHLPEYAELGRVHDEVHRCGPEIMRLHKDGLTDEARSRLPQLQDLKQKILHSLLLLQQQVAESYGEKGGQFALVSEGADSKLCTFEKNICTTGVGSILPG